jgi:predicted lactoylglutathione lyase
MTFQRRLGQDGRNHPHAFKESTVQFDRATLCLPIADRRASHTFYTALGFEPVGELGEDGLPEPMQIQVSDGLRMMLIPTGGFGWVIGDRDVARSTAHECILAVGLPTETQVDDLMRRAQDAGANVVYPPGNQAWGSGDDTSDDSDDSDNSDDTDEIAAYAGVFADPDGHLWQVSRADGILVQ